MAKLRIAVWHNLPSGGGKRALWHHIAGLVERGHQVESWCPATAEKDYLPLAGLCREHILPLTLPEEKKSLPMLGWLSDYRTMQARITAMREHCRMCAGQINAGGFDILMANSCSAFAMPSIARFVKIPSAVYLGEPNRLLFEAMPDLVWAAPNPREDCKATAGLFRLLPDTLKILNLRLQMREEIGNARYFDRILVNSYFSRENVLRAYGLESSVCYLGIDTKHFHPTEATADHYVIGVGSVHYHKGVDRAVRALAVIPPGQRPKLIWVGNHSSEQNVREYSALAQRLGVELEFKIIVPEAELVSLLGRATALLFTARLEPFGLAPLEANACGTPVVAIAEGGARESIISGENGLLAADARPETIAATLREILDNPAHLSALRRRSRIAIETRWGMADAISRLESALAGLLAEKASP